MIRNLFIFLFFVQVAYGDIRIESPRQYQLTSQTVIDFVATSTIDKGFMMVNGQLIPIRKKTVFPNLKLQMGRNVVDVHVLNEDLKLEPHLSRTIEIYRHLPITGANDQEIRLLTDLITDYFVPVVIGEDARLDQPILNRDLFAFLMWFFKDQSPTAMTRQYNDMANYGPYIRLFEHHPNALPLPQMGSFYPNSYVTRQAFVNLLLVLNGSAEQISTSMMVSAVLNLPRSVRSLVPAWEEPMVFVTRGEVLTAFFRLYNGPKVSPSTVTLIKTSRDQVLPDVSFLPHVTDKARQWREALRFRGVAYQSYLAEKARQWREALRFRGVAYQSYLAEKSRQWREALRFRLVAYQSYLAEKGRQWREALRFRGVAYQSYLAEKSREWRETLRFRGVAYESKPALMVKKTADGPMPPKKPMVSSSISKPRVTVVLPGDSIQKIARRHYGDASNWAYLVQLNQLELKMVTIDGKLLTSVHIEPGQKLRLE